MMSRYKFTDALPFAPSAIAVLMAISPGSDAQVIKDFYLDDLSNLNCIASSHPHGASAEEVIAKTIAMCPPTGKICTLNVTSGPKDSGQYDHPFYYELTGTHGGANDVGCPYPIRDRIYARIDVIVDNTSKPQNCRVSDLAGNPINLDTGEKFQSVDLGFSLGSESFSLSYRSPSQDGLRPPGAVGLWELSAMRRLVISTDLFGSVIHVNAVRKNGGYVQFTNNNNDWVTSADSAARLVAKPDGWILTDLAYNRIEQYDAQGTLKSITAADGARLTYDSTNGAQVNVSDIFGRKISLAFQAGVATSISSPSGDTLVKFSYLNDKLSSIVWSDQTTHQLLYEDSRFPTYLTGLVDENNSRTSTYSYDNSGFAISTERAGGVDRFVRNGEPFSSRITTGSHFDYATRIWFSEKRWDTARSFSAINPANQAISYSPKIVAGTLVSGTKSQPAGSGCAASVSAQEYDINGNLSWNQDFRGNRICYANDLNRNLETGRVEGLATGSSCSDVLAERATLPVGARKFSTQWHPNWHRETKVAEPRRVTTSVYNGQPDPFNGGAVASCAPVNTTLPDGSPIVVLCKQVEQATTDANGALGFTATVDTSVPNRVQQWTYNQYGQVLTAKDPLNNTTTHVYYTDTTADHTLGDLWTVTNALNQSIQFTKYNPAGQWLTMVDANGTTTTRTFDLRQRVKSTTTGTLTTSYDYWPTGLLKTVTLPDASTVNYGYDDAHRLTSVTDSLGNQIVYTLDNSGNRIGETVTDPSGKLAKTLTRVPDALNRIQQVTGRE